MKDFETFLLNFLIISGLVFWMGIIVEGLLWLAGK